MILHAARVYNRGWTLETLVKLYKKSEHLFVKESLSVVPISLTEVGSKNTILQSLQKIDRGENTEGLKEMLSSSAHTNKLSCITFSEN